ncbi:MAG TPA: aldehyde dehydrogenase family protein [Vicinamibacterales bacterium]
MKEPRFGSFVGGTWHAPSDGDVFADENPAVRGSVLAYFHASTPADVVAAIDHAAAAFPAWRALRVGERQQLGQRFLDLLRQRQDEVARIVSLENGKTIREARAEVASALIEGAHHVHQIATFGGHAPPTGVGPFTGWVRQEPLGVVAVISPWNFPMNVMCRKALPALLTGNTVVFKPATFTPWSGVTLAGIFSDAGFPPGVFNCVTGAGQAVGSALVDDPRVRAISFTGSTAVGKQIQARAAGLLTRTQLELGGKNALIVMDDADLDAAVEAAVVAGFACAGQWCTSTSRLLLQRGIHDAFLEALVERCRAMRVGDPLDEQTDMGPVAGPHQFAAVTAAIEHARHEGARHLTGGLGHEAGYFISPTVLADVTPAMDVFRAEVFGPVLAATPFDRLADAVALANDSAYGLSSALFTQDVSAAMRYINDIHSGLAHVNIHTGFKDPGLPFGGWKDSGFGPPENARSGLEFFVDQKAVYVKS